MGNNLTQFFDASGAIQTVSPSHPFPNGPTIGGSTTTVTRVAQSAANTALLAANANRKGASIFNESGSILYVLVNSGVSSITNYTVQLPTNGYFEVPFGYTGSINGIWAAAGASAAQVTEYT